MPAAPEDRIFTPLGTPEGPSPLPDPAPDPFALLGLKVDYAVDAADLQRRLRQFSRWLHPDFFGGEDQAELRELAERNTAELHAAHALLEDQARRAEWLLGHLDGPDQESERQMPQAFLLEVMEWNETLEEASDSEPESPEREALDELAEALHEQRAELLGDIAARFSPLPPPSSSGLVEVRKLLNAVRYVDRTLESVKALRLQQASSR